jgi:DNA-binding response OmpR family regulator
MPRVLVVADEPWVRNEVHAALSEAGIDLIDHVDPETVAVTAAADDIDVVLVDLQVGSMGGMAVTRAMKDAQPEGRTVPVIMLLDRPADSFLAGRAGAEAWVTKPFDADELRHAVKSVTVPDPT